MSFLAVQNFRTLLSTCPKWISLTGADNASAALAFIYNFARDTEPTLPAAYLSFEASNEELIGTGTWLQSGTIAMSIELARRSAATLSAEYAAVGADWDTLTAEIRTASLTSGAISIRSISRQDATLATYKKSDDFWLLRATFDYPNSL